MPTKCEGMGFGLSIDDGEVTVVLSLFEAEGEEEPFAYALLKPGDAVAIGQRFMLNALSAAQVEAEIKAIPPDDREAGIRRVMDRLTAAEN